MSKEVEDRQSSSNVVAKLMGLDTAAPRSKRSRSSSRCSLSSVDNHEAGKFHKHHREFEDGYEIWESLPHKGNLSRKCDGSMSDKRLDLVRRKFVEAKRLVTNDKLRRSKEFQEALEVLSSNKDLFVKFLQQSDSLFSQHLSDIQPDPPHPEAKQRITVLRPSMPVDAQKCVVQDNRSKQIKKFASPNHETGWINDVQPTRIVVLKPSPGKAIASSSPSSYFDEAGDAETRQVAKELTRQIRESFTGHCRNKTTLSSSSSSSVLSNGYIGNDGSFNKSNNECPVGNISNSEIMSPSSRHSWDCENRFESPFSSSSFSRVPFPPQSSVYREAKKQLSKRWAMISLNRDIQQKSFPKASTVLGDMLALSETKVPTISNEESIKSKQETRRSVSCIGSGLDQVESTSGSLKTRERSKSVPEIRLNGGTSVSGTSKARAARNLTESRSIKSSWKVSSLFFFRNKKENKDKTVALSQLAMPTDVLQHISTSEGEVTTPNENQDQPSPVSVLQPPFEEEYVGNTECSGSTKPWTSQGEEMSQKSNLIDKSPPIGSIARVFAWEDESDIAKPGTGIKEDEDWFYFIKTLLKASGFSGSDPLMTSWHSPDSPLDPSLRDTFANKELIKRRKQLSNRKLVFDCVNAIITETTSTAARTDLTSGFDMVEHVWTELKNWAAQDSNSLEGERVVSDEINGKVWSHTLQVEVNNLGTEIEVILLQELVEEAVFDLTR